MSEIAPQSTARVFWGQSHGIHTGGSQTHTKVRACDQMPDLATEDLTPLTANQIVMEERQNEVVRTCFSGFGVFLQYSGSLKMGQRQVKLLTIRII